VRLVAPFPEPMPLPASSRRGWGEWLESGKEAIDAMETVTKIAMPIGTGITVVFGWLGWSSWWRKNIPKVPLAMPSIERVIPSAREH
jgi:hypothetical protein